MVNNTVDIGSIVDHHYSEEDVSFVDIGRIIDHHCLEVVEPPLNSDGQQYYQYQQN
jgi:hypothetical protein